MDQYGCFRNVPNDLAKLQSELKLNGNICFAYSGDGVGCLIVLITKTFLTLGTIPFGGDPVGRVFISIEGRGAFHFADEKTHASYFEEKLNLTGDEGIWMEKLWDALWVEESQ